MLLPSRPLRKLAIHSILIELASNQIPLPIHVKPVCPSFSYSTACRWSGIFVGPQAAGNLLCLPAVLVAVEKIYQKCFIVMRCDLRQFVLGLVQSPIPYSVNDSTIFGLCNAIARHRIPCIILISCFCLCIFSFGEWLYDR